MVNLSETIIERAVNLFLALAHRGDLRHQFFLLLLQFGDLSEQLLAILFIFGELCSQVAVRVDVALEGRRCSG